MRKLLLSSLLLAAIVALILPAFAEPPAYRLKEAELQKKAFSKLTYQQAVTVTSTAAITADDVTATNTMAVQWLPDDTVFPVKLVIKNNNALSGVVYVPYDDGLPATSGVVIPTATAARLVDEFGSVVKDGKSYETILFRDPELSFGVITTTPSAARADQEIIFEIWSRPEIDY